MIVNSTSTAFHATCSGTGFFSRPVELMSANSLELQQAYYLPLFLRSRNGSWYIYVESLIKIKYEKWRVKNEPLHECATSAINHHYDWTIHFTHCCNSRNARRGLLWLYLLTSQRSWTLEKSQNSLTIRFNFKYAYINMKR